VLLSLSSSSFGSKASYNCIPTKKVTPQLIRGRSIGDDCERRGTCFVRNRHWGISGGNISRKGEETTIRVSLIGYIHGGVVVAQQLVVLFRILHLYFPCALLTKNKLLVRFRAPSTAMDRNC
jgi:hypothetical protein